jgi:C4-dicarboxylate-specific signal transduction histidine kinase
MFFSAKGGASASSVLHSSTVQTFVVFRLRANGVSVRMQLAVNLPFIKGDRVQLQQVMLSLVINAVDA